MIQTTKRNEMETTDEKINTLPLTTYESKQLLLEALKVLKSELVNSGRWEPFGISQNTKDLVNEAIQKS